MTLDEAASALRWWRESGVDTPVAEGSRNWLDEANVLPSAAPAAPRAAPPAPPSAPPPPDDLLGFRRWLVESPDLPGAHGLAGRVPPAGEPGRLMVLIDMPSIEDVAAGKLLSGEEGALFDRMMSAIGQSRETLYIASMAPWREPTGRWTAQTARALAQLALRHVALAAPETLLLFGDNVARALLGAPVARARGRWHDVAAGERTVPAIATLKPDQLIAQPGLKKLAWEDLQRLAAKGEEQ